MDLGWRSSAVAWRFGPTVGALYDAVRQAGRGERQTLLKAAAFSNAASKNSEKAGRRNGEEIAITASKAFRNFWILPQVDGAAELIKLIARGVGVRRIEHLCGARRAAGLLSYKLSSPTSLGGP
jgi:hypothetical protein